MSTNSFGSQSQLQAGDRTYEIFRLSALEQKGIPLGRLPFSLRILLENLLRHEDGKGVTAADIGFLASCYLIGAVTGALYFGHLTDRYGRKKM